MEIKSRRRTSGGRTERQKQIEKQGCKDAKARRTSVKRSVSQLRIEQEISHGKEYVIENDCDSFFMDSKKKQKNKKKN